MATRGKCDAVLIISHDPKRTRFTKTVNRGIKRAPVGSDIMILNDDILQFYPGWLATLQRALYSNSKFGLVGPGGGSHTAPMSGGQLGMQGLEVVKHIPFWCVLIKRKIIDKVGLLDEAFWHYASDSWYCDCVRKAGYQCVWVKDVFLKHKPHGSKLQSDAKKHDQALYKRRLRRGK